MLYSHNHYQGMHKLEINHRLLFKNVGAYQLCRASGMIALEHHVQQFCLVGPNIFGVFSVDKEFSWKFFEFTIHERPEPQHHHEYLD